MRCTSFVHKMGGKSLSRPLLSEFNQLVGTRTYGKSMVDTWYMCIDLPYKKICCTTLHYTTLHCTTLLVGGLEHLDYFPRIYWECHHPNWLWLYHRISYVSEGLLYHQPFNECYKPTSKLGYIMLYPKIGFFVVIYPKDPCMVYMLTFGVYWW